MSINLTTDSQRCVKCLTMKQLDQFGKSKRHSNGFNNHCRTCRNDYQKQYKNLDKTRWDKYSKNWRIHNKKYIEQWKKQHPDYGNQYYRKRKSDLNYVLARNMRSRLYKAIKNKQKRGSAIKDLGCTIAELRKYLKSKFTEGMTWKNYGKWHIDHVIPLSKLDLSKRTNFLLACHYTNLQPMWAVDNWQKRSKYG